MKSPGKRAKKRSRGCLAAKATQRSNSPRVYSKSSVNFPRLCCSRIPVGRVSVAHRATATNSIFVPFVIQKLLHHGTEGQHDFAVDFVEHLRKAGVDGGEPTENSFVA